MEGRYLLISDLDGTLLGDDEALREFAEWCDQRRDRLRLVYSSGRLVTSILDSIESTDLPAPDAVIGGVGTQIAAYPSLSTVGEWPHASDSWQPLRICSVLSAFDELELQPAEFLSEHKISYYAEDAAPELIDEIRRRLLAAACQVELVYSSHRDLDVLPAGVNKGSAAAFVAAHLSYPADRVVVSGDTGNDLSMFENGFRGIVVGNAHRELKGLNSPLVFHADEPYAAGVQQGLSHWLSS